MNNLKKFYLKTIKHDLTNKFLFKNTKNLPNLKKISLNFGYKNNDSKLLLASLLALELISNQKGKLTITNYPNVLLKLRKGSPVGCKATLRKNEIFNFINEIVTDIFPKIKNFEGLKNLKENEFNTFSYEIKDIFSFKKLEDNYYLFNDLSKLTITITTTCKQKNQLLFLLNSLKTPFTKT